MELYDTLSYILFAILIIIVICTIIYNILSLRSHRKDRELLQTVTDLNRGTISEQDLVLNLLKQGIPASTVFHDLYIEKYNGNYSQIDVVMATRVGIIVFEVKDYSGWIFGNGFQTYWTQILAYGERKYRFYNPVLQNKGHINTLKRKLRPYADVPFYSIIVFYGDCLLKDVSSIPDRTYIAYPDDVPDIINAIFENNIPANYKSKPDVIRILKEGVNNGNNTEIIVKHIEYIQQM